MNTLAKKIPDSVRLQTQSPWRRVAVEFMSSPTAVVGLLVLLVIVLVAVLAPWIVVQNPYDLMQLNVLDARLAPGSVNMDSGYTYWLGTDGQGRDLVSAIMYGLRISLRSEERRV